MLYFNNKNSRYDNPGNSYTTALLLKSPSCRLISMIDEPVKIIDLAKRMVELSGLTLKDDANPNGDIEIQVTGLRPGEKLYEELLIGDNPLPTSHSRIMKAHEVFLPWDELQAKIADLTLALEVNDVPFIRILLKDLVPGYQPEGEVVDWIWLAQQSEISGN